MTELPETINPLQPPAGIDLAMVWDENTGLWNRLRQSRIERLEWFAQSMDQRHQETLDRIAALEARVQALMARFETGSGWTP